MKDFDKDDQNQTKDKIITFLLVPCLLCFTKLLHKSTTRLLDF